MQMKKYTMGMWKSFNCIIRKHCNKEISIEGKKTHPTHFYMQYAEPHRLVLEETIKENTAHFYM